MKVLIRLAFCLLAAASQAAEIENVMVVTTYDDKIEVHYDLIGDAGATYDVSLEVYDADKTSIFTVPKTHQGDIGEGIKPGEDLTITWDVFQDMSSLTGVYVFNIVATRVSNSVVYTPPSGTPTKPWAGGPRTGAYGTTKDFMDGGFLSFGYSSLAFVNAAYDASKASGTINHKGGGGMNWVTIRMPFLLGVSVSYHSFETEAAKISGPVSYVAGDVVASVCPLPFFKNATPYVGVGYRWAGLEADTFMGADSSTTSSKLNVSSPFYQAGLQLSIPWKGNFSGIKGISRIFVGTEYKHSFGEESRKWRQFSFFIGIGGGR